MSANIPGKVLKTVKTLLGKRSAQKKADKYHFNLYNRYPITLVKGKGAKVWDDERNEYIDALAGIAVNSLGHCHPRIVKAIQKQAAKLMHISNFYYNEPQSDLAEKLVNVSGMDRAFFCNSGAEAVEGAIKLARRYSYLKGKTGTVLSMESAFHGRTLATITMGKDKYREGYEPLPSGFTRVPFNDVKALKKAIDEHIVAVILEPIQGEGGVTPVTKEFLQTARGLCDEYDIPLILDEVQTGIARTGKMFAFQHYGIVPDIIASAKALGSGFPIGAVIAKEKFAKAFSPGNHGTTYGGNPLACAAALETLKTIEDEEICDKARVRGNYMMQRLKDLSQNWSAIREVRGLGLMIGVELSFPGREVVNEMLKRGVLSNCASEVVIRIVPPLIISKEEIDTVIDVLVESIKEVDK
ncbi:aspartate aminotransferase family protein [Rhodohalobacter halophilus]|uniref:aspartate aminotransferase family protein n=1 Tax=Rhodohalobacter halophilus TaxID=1812810 RepID=UPI0009FB9535|nr:aspartate aminotransferase family protein [Rhodohalobacter halophilus]